MKLFRRLKAARGSIAPLAIGLALISLVTVLMSVSAGSVFLLQRRLTSLAEFAALSRVESGTLATDFLLETNPKGFYALTVVRDEVIDGVTSEVRLCSTWTPPLRVYFIFVSRQVCGFGAARAG